ncbi:hypothetical protein CVIRNUC_004708 [Coccomyxa viridis]|uniref:Aminotransferase class V domain-containing protein n=1 Tax=Coccomyxa viridis TaxID=1274662 RepID=A0AAV1I2I5_9CHLO|nr:hypothetical protein CVIRNUC_004708 [Coccomyxa viridis]
MRGVDDWESENPLVTVAKHFVTKGCLILGVWGLKHFVWKRDNHTGGREKKQYRVLHNPEKQFKPVHPRWLIDAAASADTPVLDISRLLDWPARYQELCGDVILHHVRPGQRAREELFDLSPEWTYLNHGSYGATLRFASEVQSWFWELAEQQPVLFMETQALPILKAARQEVAALIGARSSDVVPVANATTAASAVISSVPLRRGDLLLMTSLTYPAVRNALARAAGRAGAGLLQVQLPIEVLRRGPKAVHAAFREALSQHRGRVKLAVIDHVASFPPVLFDVKALCSLCRGSGAKVLVDGAHAIGAMPLSVPSLGAHFYCSNLHKWAATAKGCAFLWVAPSEQQDVLPLVTSHGYGLGFQGEWLWQGTSDMSAWLSAPAALYVVSCIGREKWMQHNSALLKEAAGLLRTAFGTEHVLGADGPYACMAAIELPSGLPLSASAPDAQHLQRILRERFRIEVPISAWEGALWARISAQYYNQLADYKRLAKAVMMLVKEAQRNTAAGGTSWRSEDYQERLAAEVGTNGFAMTHQ